MSKLTADKCKEHIGWLKECQWQGLIQKLELDYLQALEIALPVLEQQEKGNDGWIEWGGGMCPVDGDVMVDVCFRNGEIDRNMSAGGWYWGGSSDLNYERDIIAYRVIEHQEGE